MEILRRNIFNPLLEIFIVQDNEYYILTYLYWLHNRYSSIATTNISKSNTIFQFVCWTKRMCCLFCYLLDENEYKKNYV